MNDRLIFWAMYILVLFVGLGSNGKWALMRNPIKTAIRSTHGCKIVCVTDRTNLLTSVII